jgi:superfamily II DNA or RNA helicase
MIKSSYGTGKTYLFKKLMDEYKYKKVVFITYRQSLAYSLIEELRNDYGFKSYLDEGIECYKEPKIIIQLDSIEKLTQKYFLETQSKNR